MLRSESRIHGVWVPAFAGRTAEGPRNEQPRHRPRFLDGARRRHGAALLVSAVVVLAAYSRLDLLADGADADVGLPADLRLAAGRLLRAGRRRFHRLGAAVGHPVSRPARLLDLVSGGDVRAQPG